MTYPIRVEAEESGGIAVVSLKPATKDGRFPDSQRRGARILGRPKCFPNKVTT